MKRTFHISITWARRRSFFNFSALSFSSSDLKIFCKRFGLFVIRNPYIILKANQQKRQINMRNLNIREEVYGFKESNLSISYKQIKTLFKGK